jgi:hypothetical protein
MRAWRPRGERRVKQLVKRTTTHGRMTPDEMRAPTPPADTTGPGGQPGTTRVQRDRPCTLTAGSSDKPLPDPHQRYAQPAPASFNAPSFSPLTQTGFDLERQR